MSMLRNVEKSSYTIFKCNDGPDVSLNVTVTNLYGNKNKDDERLDPLYITSYESKKYSNRDKLQELKIDPKTYLVFSFVNYENKEEGEVVREDIFTSFPDLNKIYQFIDEINECIFGETSTKIFRKKKKKLLINEDYSQLIITAEDLGVNEKTLRATPAIIENEETGVDEKGIILYINNDENYITLGEKAVDNLIIKFSDLNLTNMSMMLFIMTMLGFSGSIGSDDDNSGSGKTLRRRAVVPPRRGSSSNNFKGKTSRNSIEDNTEVEESDEEELDFTDEEEEDEAPIKRKSSKKSSSASSKKVKPRKSSSTSTKSKKKSTKPRVEEDDEDDDEEETTSFKDLMKAAEEVEYDEEELDFDDEDDE